MCGGCIWKEKTKMDGNYVAMAVTLAVWIGLFVYLMKLDGKVKKLEEKLK